jgi:hypothetical protein
MTNTNDEKIIVQVNDEVIELLGAEKEAFIVKRQQKIAEYEAQEKAKLDAKTAAEGKLAALGLTTNDLRALGL